LKSVTVSHRMIISMRIKHAHIMHVTNIMTSYKTPPLPERQAPRKINYSLRLSPETAAAVEEIAAKKEWSAAQVLTRLVEIALASGALK
jgi:hypothetical protein